MPTTFKQPDAIRLQNNWRQRTALLLSDITPPQVTHIISKWARSRWANPDNPNPLSRVFDLLLAMRLAGRARSDAVCVAALVADMVDDLWPNGGRLPMQLERDVSAQFHAFVGRLADMAQEGEVR